MVDVDPADVADIKRGWLKLATPLDASPFPSCALNFSQPEAFLFAEAIERA